jgi:hypothetical protein
MSLFPEAKFQRATQTIVAIKEITEDKQMYDATEKARRDRQWALNAKLAEGELKGKIEGKIEGKVEGEIKFIRTLEGLLGRVPTPESQLKTQKLEELQKIAIELQAQLRSRIS